MTTISKKTKLLHAFRIIFGKRVAKFVRKYGTAILTPFSFSKYSGHYRSSLAEKAVTRNGKPLPWFTYPAIDFLVAKDFGSSKVLEFGGGQSTVFWSKNSESVVTFETDEKWISEIEKLTSKATNVTILKAPTDPSQKTYVSNELEGLGEKFDVIIIDGMRRSEMFCIAMKYLSDGGMVICDNAEGYGFHEIWQNFPQYLRIDFYGHVPGVINPQATSIIFDTKCKFLNIKDPIYIRRYGANDMPYL